MSYLTLLPILAAIPVLFVAIFAMKHGGAVRRITWVVPALFCAGFAAWSGAAIIQESPTGFWPVHTQTMWGNQVWFDLLMALTMAWFLILPRAKRAGMRLPLWLIFILCTGSIGFSAMLARMLFLETKKRLNTL